MATVAVTAKARPSVSAASKLDGAAVELVSGIASNFSTAYTSSGLENILGTGLLNSAYGSLYVLKALAGTTAGGANTTGVAGNVLSINPSGSSLVDRTLEFQQFLLTPYTKYTVSFNVGTIGSGATYVLGFYTSTASDAVTATTVGTLVAGANEFTFTTGEIFDYLSLFSRLYIRLSSVSDAANLVLTIDASSTPVSVLETTSGSPVSVSEAVVR
tara:strand:+ start:1721 stop:2365 length:645 start_codon:yes stop_codon:yes gene_type:complete